MNLNDEEEKKTKLINDQSKDEDKSIDLSMNISRFKKSLSDPNLMFNDVDSDDNDHLNDKNKKDALDNQIKKVNSNQI